MKNNSEEKVKAGGAIPLVIYVAGTIVLLILIKLYIG